MKAKLCRLLIFLSFIGLSDSEAVNEETVKALEKEIKFSKVDGFKSFRIPSKQLVKSLGRQIGRELTKEEESAFLTRADSIVWKTYEDEVIRFDYPDNPLISVQALDHNNSGVPPSIAMEGVVTTVDNRYRRAYQLSVGKDRLPYALILATEADWFDEGICLCGAIKAERFVADEGNLLLYSFTYGVDLKKIQVLGAKRRAIFFEWTHSSLPQDVYLRMAHSIRLKDKSPRSEKEWIEFTKEKGGAEQVFKWIRPGATQAEVIALAGEPHSRSDDRLSFLTESRPADKPGSRAMTRVEFSDGIVAGIDKIRERYQPLAPPKGTLAWADFRVFNAKQPFLDVLTDQEKKFPPLGEAEVEQIFELFLKQAPTANSEDWERWCFILAMLGDDECRDPRVLPILLKRWREHDVPCGNAAWLLRLYEVEDRKALVLERIQRILMGTPDANGSLRFEDEIQGLFGDLDAGWAETPEFIASAIGSPSAEIRKWACHRASYIPELQRRHLLMKRLTDASALVREFAIWSFSEIAKPSDVSLLTELMGKEECKDTREVFSIAIEKLAGTKPAN